MAFTVAADLRYFGPIGGQSAQAPVTPRANGFGHPAVWSFKTEDAHATVDGADYFLPIINMLALGDIIFVVVVTNRGAANEATVTYGTHLVNAKSATAIDTTNVAILTVSDSD